MRPSKSKKAPDATIHHLPGMASTARRFGGLGYLRTSRARSARIKDHNG